LALPTIQPDANKYTRGSLLVLGGSRRFPGAAILAARAAALTGAGYVTLATPTSIVPVAQTHMLSIPVVGAKEEDGAFASDGLRDVLKQVRHIDAVVIGCGLTVTSSTTKFVHSVQAWANETKTPLLIDADALGATRPCSALSPLFVLTPHPGEIARLFASTSTSTAEELARYLNAVVVAKGPTSIITDGANRVVCDEGTPALAKAGTGDVLSGMIGSLLAQGMESFEAAWSGVILHARAGRCAEERYGTRSVMAEHLLEAIPVVLCDALA